MFSNQNSLLFIVFLIISCTNNRNEQREANSHNKVQNKQSSTYLDSISVVDVIYYPAFNNSSILHLDRIRRVGSFQVDTAIKYSLAAPESLSFPLADFESKSSNKLLWDEHFIQSLRIDTTRPIPTDGMSVWIFYTKGQKKDSVYLGNSHPNRVDSVLLDQLNYINNKTINKGMKHYIKDVKGYL
jgi:hypothetical protein